MLQPIASWSGPGLFNKDEQETPLVSFSALYGCLYKLALKVGP